MNRVIKNWVEELGIRGIEPYLDYYIEKGLISQPSDVFKLTARILYSNPDISTEEITTIYESIDNSRDLGLGRILLGLLPDVEVSVIREAIISSSSMDAVINKLSKYYPDLDTELQKLDQLGVNLSIKDDGVLDEQPLEGKIIVVSGTLSENQQVVKGALEDYGAEVREKLDKEVDYLLVGARPGKSVGVAKELGVEVLTEGEIAVMLGVE